MVADPISVYTWIFGLNMLHTMNKLHNNIAIVMRYFTLLTCMIFIFRNIFHFAIRCFHKHSHFIVTTEMCDYQLLIHFHVTIVLRVIDISVSSNVLITKITRNIRKFSYGDLLPYWKYSVT